MNIVINGTSMDREQATGYLSKLKKKYNSYKDLTGSFIFDGQEVLCSYAKYLIEYLENCLKEEK